jgi:lipopolysaccharide transport system permease protein
MAALVPPGFPLGRAGLIGFARAGVHDILDGVRQWRIWYLLGSADMRRRYARSRLGQVWIMLSSAIMISSIGLVWSLLWRQPVNDVLPFIAVSLVVWQLVSGVLTDATTILPANSHYFFNQYMAASTIIFSALYRQLITFLLNMIFPIGLALSMGVNVTSGALLALPGLILVCVACLWMGFVVAVLCTRFRDLIQLVNSALQVAFFITPVLWKPEFLSPADQTLVLWNPLADLLAIVRDPLLGRPVSAGCWIAASLVAVGGLLLSLPIIGRFRRRIVYWL